MTAVTAADGRPVIAGFAPDPSICRVGASYFLAVSSFEYFPGVPIWQSEDLVSWRLIGHAFDRPEQLQFPEMTHWLTGDPISADGTVLPYGAGSTGISAPTIRYHDGRFWLVVADLNRVGEGPMLIWADSPSGPWSDPVRLSGLRAIDPDLAWDDDGTCYVAMSSYASGGPSISCVVLDTATGRLLGEPFELWQGTGGLAPEAPHLYQREGWWYLMLAEGGTERGHSVTIARSRSIRGSWEPCPANPILTHRGLPSPVQNTGHADLIETAGGEWAAVYLGVRPRGVSQGFHVNGRETFVAGVDWVDGWPVFDENRYPVPEPATGFIDTFADGALHPRWIAPGRPAGEFAQVGPGGLELRADGAAASQPPVVGVRTRDDYWSAEADIVLSDGDARLVVRIDESHFAAVDIGPDGMSTTLRIGDLERVTVHGPVHGGTLTLGIRAISVTHRPWLLRGPDRIELGWMSGDEWHPLDAIDGRYLSSEVAGGWTGRVVGVQALRGGVVVPRFSYRPL